MQHRRGQTHGRRTRVLLAAGTAIVLVCAGNVLAGTVVPVPTAKPDSVSAEALLQATPVAFAVPPKSAPLPPAKPQRPVPVSLGPAESVAAQDQVAVVLPPVPPHKPAHNVGALRALLKPAEEVAAPRSAAAVTPISNRDADLYRTIFSAQSDENWAAADDAMARLGDQRLRGHVLFQRYMHPTYKASFAELQGWMAAYADLPGADRIYRLAAARKGSASASAVTRPRNQIGLGLGTLHIQNASTIYAPDKKRSAQQRGQVVRLVRAVNDDISRGAPTKAMKRLNSDTVAKLMDNVEYDQLRGQIANGYLLMGKPVEARALALASARRSGAKAPMAGWAGGLAAWMLGDYREAATMFEYTASSSYVSGWMQAAGAYWASRAHMRAGNMKQVSVNLEKAATHPRTFYGMLATRSLGWDFDFNWASPEFTRAHYTTLATIPAAARAMALVQAGQNHLAEAELLQVDPDGRSDIKEALIAYTHEAHLPALSMRLANNFERPDGGLYDAALYPLLPWEPNGGYTIDRALIHAIARQESKFDTWAKSGSGAIGLMQVMPSTAGYVMDTRRFAERSGKHSLTNPETNLEIGQKYVDHLLEQDEVSRDLMALAVAYNAGPGNLRKWKRELTTENDPLLFIEMIPMAETRNYVERVMANYWIYAMRMGQQVPTLDLVVEGKQAAYAPMDGKGSITRLTQAIRPFRMASN